MKRTEKKFKTIEDLQEFISSTTLRNAEIITGALIVRYDSVEELGEKVVEKKNDKTKKAKKKGFLNRVLGK